MSQGHGLNFIGMLSSSIGLGDYEPLVTAALVAGGVAVLGTMAASRLQRERGNLIPDARLSLKNVFDLLVQFVVMMGDMVMGKHNRHFLPFVCTIFIFILGMNLVGLIPGFSAPTDDLVVNGGIAITVFIAYHLIGIREVGFLHYVKHFFGPTFPGKPLIWILPFILVFRLFMLGLELISHTVRPLTLSLRLFGNMTADHAVLSAFMSLFEPGGFGTVPKLLVPLPFYALGTFVCFIQASVFTLLTMVYISLAVAHEEEEH